MPQKKWVASCIFLLFIVEYPYIKGHIRRKWQPEREPFRLLFLSGWRKS